MYWFFTDVGLVLKNKNNFDYKSDSNPATLPKSMGVRLFFRTTCQFQLSDLMSCSNEMLMSTWDNVDYCKPKIYIVLIELLHGNRKNRCFRAILRLSSHQPVGTMASVSPPPFPWPPPLFHWRPNSNQTKTRRSERTFATTARLGSSFVQNRQTGTNLKPAVRNGTRNHASFE